MAPAAGPPQLTQPALHRPALGDHRLLGNGRSAALLGPAAEIDWWCGPEVDSRPLWSLLDPAGAAARWEGVEEDGRPPEPAGPVLRTVLRKDGVRVDCRDALVEEGLVRLVRCDDADLELSHRLALGGFDRACGTWDGAVCHLDDLDVAVAVGGGGGRRTARVGS